ncbi:MAG: PEP-CTERM sorting domain-containing protein [Candidatus Desantisbacteria bacterium]
MKRRGVVIFGVLLVVIGANAQADILHDRFGIELRTNTQGYFTHDWTPVGTTANYVVHDNKFTTGALPLESYDIEAMYFDDDAINAYFAIVTSLPPQGVEGTSYSSAYKGINWGPGDIAFNLGGGTFEYGLSTVLDPGRIQKNAKWQYTEGSMGFGKLGTPEMLVGTGDYLGNASYYNYYDTGVKERGYSTWVLEGTINKSIFDNPFAGDNIGMRWSVSCNNDLVKLNANFDHNTSAVPEPATIMLLTSGLMGMMGIRKRIKK